MKEEKTSDFFDFCHWSNGQFTRGNHSSNLQSLSIRIAKLDERKRKTTIDYLSIIVKQANLRKVQLNMSNSELSGISWSMNCSIECLIIEENVQFDDLVLLNYID